MRKGSSRREREKKTTVIRRQIKKGHAAHHGGAWKVAFADFTLAMMALFMTLWIVSSVNQKERATIVAALHGQSIFHGAGMAPLNHLIPRPVASHTRSRPEQHRSDNVVPADAKSQAVALREHQVAQRVAEKSTVLKQKSAQELGALATTIYNIAQKAHMESNLEIEIIPQGIRILIKDDKKRSMFNVGSARITPFFHQLLVQLTPVFADLQNKLIITGHTDARQYKGDSYNNWNLSGDRALTARRVMENAGLAHDQVMQVSAMADQMLLDQKNPEDDSNRRIEIMVLTQGASDSLNAFFGQHGEKVIKPIIKKLDQTPAASIAHQQAVTAPR